MTIVVGYLAGKSGTAPLHLALMMARSLDTPLTVATVVPKSWTTPSPAKIDAEYAAWASRLAADSATEAQQFLSRMAEDGGEVSYRSHANRSASGGLLEAIADSEADLLILGSSSNGQLGQVVVGSTADRLLHSSPVPVAIAPRGYRGARSAKLTRLTCAYPGTAEAVDTVARAAELAARMKVPLRVITFAVRGRTMYPPEVGLHAEDSILAAWEEHARDMLGRLRTTGVIGDDVETLVVNGIGWDHALDATDWQDGEMLAVGTSPRSDIARVFLGSRGTKIMRHSPVPVLVFPG
ncbi:MAG: universal stress protein [Mycolicibacterium sp.]|uniref:universal stress protein n=1 Tax=Mycolicibacterium sp. TaxID=2320850 RepID=UPI003D0A7424